MFAGSMRDGLLNGQPAGRTTAACVRVVAAALGGALLAGTALSRSDVGLQLYAKIPTLTFYGGQHAIIPATNDTQVREAHLEEAWQQQNREAAATANQTLVQLKSLATSAASVAASVASSCSMGYVFQGSGCVATSCGFQGSNGAPGARCHCGKGFAGSSAWSGTEWHAVCRACPDGYQSTASFEAVPAATWLSTCNTYLQLSGEGQPCSDSCGSDQCVASRPPKDEQEAWRDSKLAGLTCTHMRRMEAASLSEAYANGANATTYMFTSAGQHDFTLTSRGWMGFLLVGGGGAGGDGNAAGGGGAGGLVVTGHGFFEAGHYSVTVGKGGMAPPNDDHPGGNGIETTVVFPDRTSIAATGGGGGNGVGMSPLQGGCGGGGAGLSWNPELNRFESDAACTQGHAACTAAISRDKITKLNVQAHHHQGADFKEGGGTWRFAGFGGGGGGAGGAATGKDGGVGFSCNITGSHAFYGGGGGGVDTTGDDGSCSGAMVGGRGGSGVGGNGACGQATSGIDQPHDLPTSGRDGTGGGGGGLADVGRTNHGNGGCGAAIFHANWLMRRVGVVSVLDDGCFWSNAAPMVPCAEGTPASVRRLCACRMSGEALV